MDDEESGDLQEPLLHDATGKQHGKSIFTAVVNLSKVIVGAGMMAIPRAYLQIGSVLGTAMLLGVALLIYFTLVVLVHGSAVTGAGTYSQLVLVTCGRPVMKLLQVALLAFCFGFGVVYLVVIRDLLLGTPPACNGLLCELLGVDPAGWLADPRLVVTAVALLICSPLLLLRSMERLSALNVIGVAAIALLAAASAGLALQGLATGSAHSIPAFPQWDLLGPTRAQQLEALTAVLPVLIACYNAAQSLHPLMPLVQPYSEQQMRRVIGLALAVSFGIYWTLSVGAVMAFGTDVEVNVLNNLSVSTLEPLVGPGLARLLSWGIRGGYLVSLLASLLLYMRPLRGCLAEMLWPDDISTSHLHLAAAAAANSEAGATGSGALQATSSGAYTVPGTQQQQQQQQDHNPIDDSRVLLAFDSMDQPAFGSWKPGFIFRRPSAPRSGSATPTAAAPYLYAPLSAGSGISSGAETPGASRSGTTAAAAANAAAYSSSAAAAAGQEGLARWQQQEQRWYYLLTYGLLGGMVLVAVAASNIWEVLSAVGDLASTIQAFVVPGLIALVLAAWSRTAAAAAAADATAAGQQQQQQQPVSPESGLAAQASKPAGASSSSISIKGGRGRGGSCRLLLQLRCDEPLVQELLLRAVHYVGGSLVVVLGLALFANGIYQRV